MAEDKPTKQEMDQKARRAIFWLYLLMAIGLILPGVLYCFFGMTTKE